MQITEFKKIGKSNRIKIYVDYEFFAVLMDESIVQNNLVLHKDYDLDYLNKVIFEGQKKVAFDTALTLISSFSKTEKELKKYLKDKGFLPSAIDYAIDKLKEYNYLNDENYAKYYINLKKDKKGKKALLFELKHKGIEDKILANLFEEVGPQNDAVLSLAEKFAKSKQSDPKLKEKLFRHLMSKGFDYEEVNSAIRQVLKQN